MTERVLGSERGDGRDVWREAEIVAMRRLTSRVVSVSLRPDRWIAFHPGQHVDVRLTAEDGYQAHRAYSVASAPSSEGTIELVIERLDDGEVSPYFHEVAAPGDRVELRGPFAEHFVWRPDSDGAALLVAGGSGVAPFLSMARERAHHTALPPMLLVYSARTWDDVIHRDALLDLERRPLGLTVLFCITRERAPRPTDFSRRIDAEIIGVALERLATTPDVAFACGASRFVGRVADLLVAHGIAPATIRTERYGGA